MMTDTIRMEKNMKKKKMKTLHLSNTKMRA
jgi:hypothetical protein